MKKDKRILIPRDEFEEEASDGLGGLSRDEAEADLRELKARLEGRIRRPRVIWLSAAAAVAILLAASAVVVSLLRERPGGGPELAELQKQAGVLEQNGDAIRDTAYIALAGPIEKAGYASEEYPSGEKAATARFVPPLVAEADAEYVLAEVADTGHEYLAEEKAADRQFKEEPVVSLMVAEEEMAEEVVVQAMPQMAEYARKARAATEVRDEKKAATGDTAAKEARPAANRDAAEQEAAAAGQPVISTGPSPVGGWDAYRNWTARNIRYPEGVEPRTRQEVQVSFTVRADSTLADLKVVRSPGEPFTREVFRLLSEGPKWVPGSSGRKAVAEEIVLKVVFK